MIEQAQLSAVEEEKNSIAAAAQWSNDLEVDATAKVERLEQEVSFGIIALLCTPVLQACQNKL